MSSTYWIVNTKTKTYMEDAKPNFDGDWRKNYPHTKNADWLDVEAYSVWDPDTINGIPFVYDLCRDGMYATLLVDMYKYNDEYVEGTKRDLRNERDVVRLKVLRLERVEG